MKIRNLKTRLLGVLSVGITIVAITAVSGAQPTQASWATADKATGSMTALTIPAPNITSCKAQNIVVLGSQIVVTWNAASGYDSSQAEFLAGSSPDLGSALGLLSGITTTGTGPYTTTFNSGALSGLLSGTVYVGIRTKHDFGAVSWTSKVSQATASVPLLLGTGSCTIA